MNVFDIIPFSLEILFDEETLLFGLKEFVKCYNSISSASFII